MHYSDCLGKNALPWFITGSSNSTLQTPILPPYLSDCSGIHNEPDKEFFFPNPAGLKAADPAGLCFCSLMSIKSRVSNDKSSPILAIIA